MEQEEGAGRKADIGRGQGCVEADVGLQQVCLYSRKLWNVMENMRICGNA